MPVGEFCRQESISVANFYHWRRKLNGAPRRAARKPKPSSRGSGSVVSSASFVQVPLAEPRVAGWIEIVAVDGTLIRMPDRNLAAFERALAALSERPVCPR
jgi:hypothetical protein